MTQMEKMKCSRCWLTVTTKPLWCAVVVLSVILVYSTSVVGQRPHPASSIHSIESSGQQPQVVVTVINKDDTTDSIITSEGNVKSSDNTKPEDNKRRRTTRGVGPVKECGSEDYECTKDKISLEAIVMLHSLLDDDHNGNVDQSESDEFLRDELQYTDGYERHSLFHSGDKLISVEDLWRAWKQSLAYNWTVADVVDWLVYHVELPQYADLFTANVVDGTQLPRLATNNHHYISGVLGIKNAVHKQKLSVKAMDVVLFGPPKKAHSYIKDLAVVTSLVIALGGCWFAYAQHKYSQSHLKRMMKDMESLQKAEDALTDMQNKLEKAEQEQLTVSLEKKNLEEKFRDEIETAKSEAERLKVAREGSLEEMSRLKLAEEELKQVRSALKRAEKELELRQTIIPSELQPFLQLTHEVELINYHTKRQAAERQLVSARDECEKIRKKRNTVMGALRMAHGSTIDEIDQRIANARAALEEVRITLQERQHRWASMEHLCGFPIVTNPGLATLCSILQRNILPSGTVAYGVAPPTLPVPLLGPVNIEDADEDLPPSYSSATASLYNFPYINGCANSYNLFSVVNPVETLKKVSPTSSSTLPKRVVKKEVRRHSLASVREPSTSQGGSSAGTDGRVKFDLGENSAEDEGRALSRLNDNNSSITGRGAERFPVPHVTNVGMIKSKSHFIINGQNKSLVRNGCPDLTSHRSDPNLSTQHQSGDPKKPRVNPGSSDLRTSFKAVREDSHSGTESTDSTESERKKDKEKKRRKFLPNFLKKDKTS